MRKQVLTYKYIWILIIINIQFASFSQNTFQAGLLFGANGIQFQGDTKYFWSSINGTIWGEAGLSTGLFVCRNISKKSNLNPLCSYWFIIV